MPLFFFLSGYTLSIDKYDFRTFFRKKLKTLILPGFVFMVVIGIYECILYKGTNITIKTLLLGGILQMRGQPIGIAWFLMCLFLSEIVLYLAVKKLKNNKRSISFVLLIVSILNFIYIKFLSKYLSITALPYSIDTIGIVLPFIYFGYLTRKENDFKFEKYNNLIIISSMLLGIILCAINYKIFGYHSDIYMDKIGSYILFYGSAISGIIGITNLFKKVKQSVILKYIGQNSLIYYVFHTTYFSTYDLILKHYNIEKDNITIAITYIILTIILTVPLIYIINRYFSYILGKSKN